MLHRIVGQCRTIGSRRMMAATPPIIALQPIATPAVAVAARSLVTSVAATNGNNASLSSMRSSLLPSSPAAPATRSISFGKPGEEKMSIKFSLEDKAGSLSEALTFFSKNNISLTRLESRPSKRSRDYDFFVDFRGSSTEPNVRALLKDLNAHCRDVNVLTSKTVPWFPRKLSDMDAIANDVLDAGQDLEADHPGFHDKVYRARRADLARIAFEYKAGNRIPRVKYTEDETRTWSTVWDKLTPLIDAHGCAEHRRMLPLLIQNCGYRRDNIPQLEDISVFLKDATGFTLRPVAGLLSARNFLYGLAFRVFFTTQYIRHHNKPLYTPEPDIVHELMGHAPLFADQDFADFSQEFGLASIGATDEQILKLARCYWFSVEFGLCRQNGERKAYGAGLLSSFGELEYSMTDKPEVREWNPFKAGEQDYPITTYQPTYYLANSFDEAKKSMHTFSESFTRPFNVRYNPYSQSIEVDANIVVEAFKPEPKAAAAAASVQAKVN